MLTTIKKTCASALAMILMITSLACFPSYALDVTETSDDSTRVYTSEELNYHGATGDLSDQVNDLTGITVIDSLDDYYTTANPIKTLKDGAIPSAVDNSKSRFFPPIDSQGSIGSCTCWATGYYQFSYSINKQLGRTATRNNSFSPKFIYNLINGGVDNGSADVNAYRILKNQGSATLAEVPYDRNYLSWSPREEIWSNTSDYRISDYYYISLASGRTPITGPNDSDLDVLKAALSNGEILTYSTYIRSWNYMNIVSNEQVPANDAYAGEKIAISMTGYNGAHKMTIVGYNDDIWVDINGNGIVEEQEMGAFKIANSWGTSYANSGFSWVSYDALNYDSSVPGVESNSSRTPIFHSIYRIEVAPFTNSNIYLSYTLNSKARYQTPVSITAEKDGTTYTEKVEPYQTMYMSNQNTYSYDGTTSANDGTMCFDLSNVVSGINSDNLQDYKWSVTFTDSTNDDYVLTVKDVKVIDKNNNKVYGFDKQLPVSLNGNSVTAELLGERDDSSLTIYYKGYNTPYIHYQVGSGNWTSVPGVAMQSTDEFAEYTHKYTIDLGTSYYANVCFNDGNGNWDSRDGLNYYFRSGTYGYYNGTITPIDVEEFRVSKLDSNISGSTHLGSKGIYLNAQAVNGTEPYEYKFGIKKQDGTVEESDYSTQGTYQFYSESYVDGDVVTAYVNVKDATGKIAYSELRPVTIDGLRITEFTATPESPQPVGTKVKFSYHTENEIKYQDMSAGTITVSMNGVEVTSFSTMTGSWTPTAAGIYDIKLSLNDYAGQKATKTIKYVVKEDVNNKITIYYKGFENPYIHYQIGNGNWTDVPGYAMTPTNERANCTHKYTINLGEKTYANVCFNDGNGNWDSRYGQNYYFEAGTYTYQNGVITEITNIPKIKSFEITPADGVIHAGDDIRMNVSLENSTSMTEVQYEITNSDGNVNIIHPYAPGAIGCAWQFTQPGVYTVGIRVREHPYTTESVTASKTVVVAESTDKFLRIYYKGYENPNIHYQIGDGDWTDVPGYPMVPTNEKQGYTHMFTINLKDAKYANVCFNDGNGNWDNNYGKDYYFEAGTYTFDNGVIKSIDGKLRIKSFGITPADGVIKAGDSVRVSLELENNTAITECKYEYIDSSGDVTTIYKYTPNLMGFSWQFSRPGVYKLVVSVRESPYSTEVITAEKTIVVAESTDNLLRIYYKGFENPNIHYQIGNGNWTDVPGYAMIPTDEKEGYTHMFTINLKNETYANVCFNDGYNNWDSRYGQNYYFGAGTYTYENGNIIKIS